MISSDTLSQTSSPPDTSPVIVNAAFQQAQPPQPQARIFELSIFIPRPTFCPDVEIPKPVLADGTPDINASYIELHLPTQGQETIRELQQSVFESAEGWWMGSFGLRRVDFTLEGKPLLVDHINTSQPEPVYGEFTELSTAFEGEAYKDLSKKRALEAVAIPYNELSARLHVIRTRDVLYSQAPGLMAGNVSHLPAYDPSQLGIGGGTSVFSLVRGPLPRPSAVATLETPTSASAPGTYRSKIKGRSRQAPSTSTKPKHSLVTDTSNGSGQPLLGLQMDGSALAGLINPRQGQPVDDGNHPPSRYLKHFAVSPWSPPPHNLRLRGHLLYLTATTLEGDVIQITAHVKGFFVNKCTTSHFDPCPKLSHTDSTTSYSFYFQSLPALLCSASVTFKDHLASTWRDALLPTFPDLFTSVGITNCLPAFPWMVPSPVASPDGVRAQLSYLMTGSTSAETLAPARDWADEFGQTRELPKSGLSDKVLRERIWSRLQADFTSAATRGAIACSRGEVAPLNPHEAEGAWTYVYNNMLFSRAEDEIGAYAHLGGTEAARIIASKDVAGVKVLNELDLPNIFTMSTAMIDYHGKRWLAQGVLPGIFRQVEPEAPKNIELDSSDGSLKTTASGIVDGACGANVSDHSLVSEAGTCETTPPPSLYDIVYGSADIEKPEAGLRSDASFHRLAKTVAEHLSLAEHVVIDFNGKHHQFWVSADTHGIKGADGRFYMIDLHRLTPIDVNFLERELDGPILDGVTDITTWDKAYTREEHKSDPSQKYPHRLVLMRLEAVQAYKQHLFRLFALDEIEQQKNVSKEAESQVEAVSLVSGEAHTNGIQPHDSEDKKSFIVDSSRFKFSFNPDAFVDRKGQAWSVAREDEDVSIKTVRDMSTFMRENLVTAFVRELADIKTLPPDGQRLTEAFHSHGINMRYLGRIAHLIRTNLPDLKGITLVSDEIIHSWKASLALIEREMVFRAFKHIYRRCLHKTTEAEACFAVSHLINCLLASGNPKAPVDDEGLFDSQQEWRSISREGLYAEIVAQIARRFRYALPTSYFSDNLAQTKPQLLREICSRLGVQILLKDYFPALPNLEKELNSTHTQPQSSDDKNLTSPNTTGKKSKVVVKGSATHCDQFLSPDDILNLLPVVKDATFRSATADELFAEGRRAFSKNQNALGQELCADAISTYEQVFGAVHPEMAKHWHALAIQFHQLTQQAVFEFSSIQEHINDCLHGIRRATTESARESMREKLRLLQQKTDVEQLKKDIDLYIELAATNLRQSVVVAERTLGLDHPNTVQHYFDLAVMELHLGNTEVGIKFARHALELWRVVYGPGLHPDASSALTQAATFIHAVAGTNDSKSPSLMEVARDLIASFYGRDSGKYGEATMILAHLWSVSNSEKAIYYASEALTLFTERYGAGNSEAKQAAQLVETINKNIEMQVKGEEERTAKLAKRLGLDPKRAAALRSKILAPVAPSQREAVVQEEEVSDGPVSPNGVRLNYDNIDDLVRYIQGPPTKNSKIPATKTTRSRHRAKR